MKRFLLTLVIFLSLCSIASAQLVIIGQIDAAESVTTGLLADQATAFVQISGTWTATLQFEGTVNGSTYFSLNASDPTAGTVVTSTAANGSWQINVAGIRNFRVRASAYTIGTATVTIRLSNGSSSSGTVNVVEPVTVDGAVTVSGTVTANQGTKGAAANGWPIVPYDSTGVAWGTGANPFAVLTSSLASSIEVLQSVAANLKAQVHLFDGAGTAITSTTVGLKQGADVYLAGGLTADAAEGNAATNNPTPIAVKARVNEIAAVDAADMVNLTATTVGGLTVYGPALPGDSFQYTVELTDTTVGTVQAGAANTYLCVTFERVVNGDAAVDTDIFVYEDDDCKTPATVVSQGFAAKAGGGWSSGSGTGVLYCTETAANSLCVAAETTSSETHVNIRGFKTKVVPSY